MKIVVTGAAGFVGSALVRRLAAEGCDVVAPVRRAVAPGPAGVRYVEGADLARPQCWAEVLEGADAVIHAAARVHRLRDDAADPEAEYRRANVDGTRALAERAAAAGVRRFVFLSSIKVNGEASPPDRPFRAEDPPRPGDAYARSKLAAEQLLLAMGRDPRLECIVVRPPLVYGPGVRANFRSMMTLVARGVPLPLGAVRAKRSLIALDNLVDLLWLCARHERAAGRVWLASDGEDLTVPDLLRRLGDALGRPARLVPVPPRLLDWAARIAGKRDLARRLLWPLQVDSEPTRRTLGWCPPVDVDQALRATARAFLAEQRR